MQELLRRAFSRWGRPGGLRVDRGCPWVSPGGLPSDLELWLAGLDVALHVNRAGRPQDNAKVERSQGTAKRWAEPQACRSAEELQRRLDEEDRVQRDVYRDDGGMTRLERHPGLLHSGRGYAAGWERHGWDAARALARLGEHRAARKVNAQGQVSLYDRHHRVGRERAGQVLEVSFDAGRSEWRFELAGAEVARCAAPQVTEEAIRLLELGARQGRSARETAARRGAGGGAGEQADQLTEPSRPDQLSAP